MTWLEVQDAVKKIVAHAATDDGPRAHSDQDELYEKFIRHVAEAVSASGEIAQMA